MIEGKRKVLGRRNTSSTVEREASEEDEQSLQVTEMAEEEKEFLNFKMHLMTHTIPDEPSLYEHLTQVVVQLLSNETVDGLSNLEDISRSVKGERLPTSTELLRTPTEVSHEHVLARAQWSLLQKCLDNQNEVKPRINESDIEPIQVVPDIMRQAMYFELAGAGLPREEFVRISLALTDLSERWPVQSVRFWGKIQGIVKNYYIAEAEFTEGDYASEVSESEEELESDLREEGSEFDDFASSDVAKPTYKPPPKIPCEPAGVGLNKSIYFVCSQPGLGWIQLPHVTPLQIQVARKIRKFFTGELDAPVVTFPPFPGQEKNYLRAQIARISAATHISPIGYFRFGDEGEEEEEAAEEAGTRGQCVEDPDFEGMAIRDLADSSMQAWVHHQPFILPQGRISWYNPAEQKDEFDPEEEESGEEEERNEPDEPEPEAGPPLLTPVSEDESVGESPAWVAATSSKFVPEYSIAVMLSNYWPGAVTVGADKGRFFESIYIGWGLKSHEIVFEPVLPETPAVEFPSGPEVTESDDPTPEEEAAVRAAVQEKELEAEIENDILDDDDDVVDDDGDDQFDD